MCDFVSGWVGGCCGLILGKLQVGGCCGLILGKLQVGGCCGLILGKLQVGGCCGLILGKQKNRRMCIYCHEIKNTLRPISSEDLQN